MSRLSAPDDAHGANLGCGASGGHSLRVYDLRYGNEAHYCRRAVEARPDLKAVAQVSKQGFVYVFDRETGKPIWPIDRPRASVMLLPVGCKLQGQVFRLCNALFFEGGFVALVWHNDREGHRLRGPLNSTMTLTNAWVLSGSGP